MYQTGGALKAPASGLHRLARLVERGLHRVDTNLDACAGLVGRALPLPTVQCAATAEEAASVDSGVQRAYRHDTLWAVPPMWWEMALGGIGAGTFTAGVAARSLPAMAVGWGVGTCGKGALLLLDLGRPERVARVFAKPGQSWIARGSWAFATFAAGGAASLYLHSVGRTVAAALPGLAALAAGGVLLSYDGLFLAKSGSVSGWQTGVLPWALAANALTAGITIAGALRPSAALGVAAVAASALTGYLAARHLNELAAGDTASRLTHDELTSGRQRDGFVVGAGVAGTLLPAALAALGGCTGSRLAWCVAATLSSAGVVYARRAVLASGLHAPVI